MNNSNTTPVTVGYIVRERNKRRFLNRLTYTGRTRGAWGLKGQSIVFSTREEAQSAASNINNRRPDGYSAYFAEVQPLVFNFKR